jgi:hypothetical protein
MTTRGLERFVARLRQTGALKAAGINLDLHDVEKLGVADTQACREAETVCREASSKSLANHCFRSYAWGAALGVAERIDYDAETFYVSALLHDIGLTDQFDRGGCFESDGADVAAELVARNEWPAPRVEIVRQSIYLHMHEVDANDPAEALLLTYGTSLDVSGRRFGEIGQPLREAVLAEYPRHGFKRHFTELFDDQAQRKPDCSVARFMAGGGRERIAAAPFED